MLHSKMYGSQLREYTLNLRIVCSILVSLFSSMYSVVTQRSPAADQFIEHANKFHPTIKFVAEISKNEITFLDKVVFKGERLKNESILDIKTQYKPTEIF